MDFSVIFKQLETADYSVSGSGSGLVGNEPLVVRMMTSKIQSHPLHNAQIKTT